MKNKVITFISIFLLAQILIWFQTYGQFKWEWSVKYRKYMDWKNEINEKKKEEISKKLDSFKGILGKSIDRDMKLDQLLGNEND